MPTGAGGPAPIAALPGPDGLPQAPGPRRQPCVGGFTGARRSGGRGGGPYPRYITRDRDDHSGGAWKGAQTIKDIRSRSTRMGTYDEQLRRIGE